VFEGPASGGGALGEVADGGDDGGQGVVVGDFAGMRLMPAMGTNVPPRKARGNTMAKPMPCTASALPRVMPSRIPTVVKASSPSTMMAASAAPLAGLRCGRQPRARPPGG
jgi:hypothetical protein